MNDKIDAILKAYTVEDADEALLNRILKAAAASRPAANQNTFGTWLRQGALLAMTASIAFWLGNANPRDAAVTATANVGDGKSAVSAPNASNDYLDQLIMGPSSFDRLKL